MSERVLDITEQGIVDLLKDPYRTEGLFVVSGTDKDAQWQYIPLRDLRGKRLNGLQMNPGDLFVVATQEFFRSLNFPRIKRYGSPVDTVLVIFENRPYLVEERLFKERSTKR